MDAPQSVPDGTDRPPVIPPCPDGQHHLRPLGYLRSGRTAGLDCDSPLRAECVSCGYSEAWRCNSHRSSRCVPCSWRYRRLVSRVAQENPPGLPHLYLLTITAPGSRRHDLWHRDTWGARPDRRPCNCHELMPSLGDWNASAGRRWNVLRGNLRRLVPDLEFFRAVEPQGRGALHLHIIVASPVALDPLAVQRLALAAGFGCVMDLAIVEPGSRRHAYYVAKYVTKAADSRAVVPWVADVVDHETGEIDRRQTMPTYRTWSSSQGWGLTMRALRAGIAADRQRWIDKQPSTMDRAISVLLEGFPGATILDVASP